MPGGKFSGFMSGWMTMKRTMCGDVVAITLLVLLYIRSLCKFISMNFMDMDNCGENIMKNHLRVVESNKYCYLSIWD